MTTPPLKVVRSELPISILDVLRPSDSLKSFLKHNVRSDGRSTDQTRTLTTKQSVVSFRKLDKMPILGSSQVKLGGTSVLATVHAVVGTPNALFPNHGDIVCNISFDYLSLSSSSSDQYSSMATDLENFVSDVLLLKGNIIDCGELSILEGRFAFRLCINISVLSNEGNLRDVLIISILNALTDVKLPAAISSPTGVELDFDVTRKLTVVPVIPVTIGVFEDYYFIDPSLQEEKTMDGYLSCIINPVDGTICYSVMKCEGISIAKVANLHLICKNYALR